LGLVRNRKGEVKGKKTKFWGKQKFCQSAGRPHNRKKNVNGVETGKETKKTDPGKPILGARYMRGGDRVKKKKGKSLHCKEQRENKLWK